MAEATAAGHGEAPSTAAQLLRRFQQLQTQRAQGYARMHEGFRAMLASKQQAPFQQLLGELTRSFNDISRQVIDLEQQLAGNHPDEAALLRRVQEGEREKLRYTLMVQALRSAEAENRFSWQQPEEGDSSAAAHAHAHLYSQAAPHEGSGAAAALAALQMNGHHVGNGVAASAANGAHAAHRDDLAATQAAAASQHPAAGENGSDTAGEHAEQGSTRGIDVAAASAILAAHHCAGHDHTPEGEQTHDARDACVPAEAPEPTEAEFRGAVAEATQLLDTCVADINEALEEVMAFIVEAEEEE